MKNLFQPSVINKENECKEFHFSQINANNYTNYFILPKNERRDNEQVAHPSIKLNRKIKAFSSLQSHLNNDKPVKVTNHYNNSNEKMIDVPSNPIQSRHRVNRRLVSDQNENESSTMNMFVNFTQDKVINKNRIKGKNNSFDYRSKAITHEEQSQNGKNNLIEELLAIYDDETDLRFLSQKIKHSIETAAEVDEMIQGLCRIYKIRHQTENVEFSQLGKWVKATAIRQELYSQQIELYRSLCEELIDKSDMKDLNDIGAYANDLIDEYDNIDSGNSYFFRSINTIIKSKYLSANKHD